MEYVHQTNDVIDAAPKPLPRSWRNVSGLDRATTAHKKSLGWLPVVYVNEAFDPATQVRTGPTGVDIGDTVAPDADGVTGTYTVRNKTQQELDDDQRADDIATLRAAVVDIALVVTEHVQWTLDNTSMIPADFTASVRQAFLDLKAIADRVK